jgi:hypothetical protein
MRSHNLNVFSKGAVSRSGCQCYHQIKVGGNQISLRNQSSPEIKHH